jgi:hypothetical protein
MSSNELYSEETVAIVSAACRARPGSEGNVKKRVEQDLHRKIQVALNLVLCCYIFNSLIIFNPLLYLIMANEDNNPR